VARKNILTGLTGNKLTAVNSSPAPASPGSALTTFAARGAAGSLSRSIGEIAAKATAVKELEAKLTAGQIVVELDAALIDPSFITDRMADPNDEAYEALKKAIAGEGQGSPILVRPHPTAPDRYQVAFGHRRLRVARDLNRPVRAVIKTLSDQELVLAQGQENSVRADLSFIERARFAQSLVELDYGRDVAMSALAVDKTTVSRMLSVTTRIPFAVIEAVGPAPAIGRDRWVELAGHFEANVTPAGLEELLRHDAFRAAASDDRFNRIADLFMIGEAATALGTGKERGQGGRHDVQSWAPSQGNTLITLKHHARRCVMNIDQRKAPGFGDFLLRQMERLYREYQADRRDR
jgi:ParB family transcriptional regulator, chromosome partitioning protein